MRGIEILLMIDLPAEPAAALRSLAAGAAPAKGTVVMNACIAREVTNLLAAQLLEENPDADDVELVFARTTKVTRRAASADPEASRETWGLIDLTCPAARTWQKADPRVNSATR
jgi:hypothetical protein